VVEVPVGVEDGAKRRAGVREESKELSGMVSAAAGIDQDPTFGPAQEDAVPVRAAVPAQLAGYEYDPRRDLRGEKEQRYRQEIHWALLRVNIRSGIASVPFC
jgi:hypothetical protein